MILFIYFLSFRDEINDENFHYVGFIKWYHSGFLALNPPDAFPHIKAYLLQITLAQIIVVARKSIPWIH